MDRDLRSGRVLSLLVRVPVDRVVEKVRADPAVVEQCVSLARRAVPDDVLTSTPELDEQLEQRTLRLADSLGEPPIGLGVAKPLSVLASEELATAAVGAARRRDGEDA